MNTKYYILDNAGEPAEVDEEFWKIWREAETAGAAAVPVARTTFTRSGQRVTLLTLFRSVCSESQDYCDLTGHPKNWESFLFEEPESRVIWNARFAGDRDTALRTHAAYVAEFGDAHAPGDPEIVRELAPPAPERDDSHDVKPGPCTDTISRRLFLIHQPTGSCWIAFDRREDHGKDAWVCTDTCACLEKSTIVGMSSAEVIRHFSRRSFEDMMDVPPLMINNVMVSENTWLASGEADYNRFVADLPHLQK